MPKDDADDEVRLTKRVQEFTESYDEALLVREAEQGYDPNSLVARRDWAALMINNPCPICAQPFGFHNEDMHRNNIDPKYLKEKGWHKNA